MTFKERYRAYPLGADASIILTGVQTGGFLAKTDGTITLVSEGVTLVDAVPVVAGGYAPIPAEILPGAVFTCGGGASGTLFA